MTKVTVKRGSKNRMKSSKELVRDTKKAGAKLKKRMTGPGAVGATLGAGLSSES
jgi:hypothetical protein